MFKKNEKGTINEQEDEKETKKMNKILTKEELKRLSDKEFIESLKSSSNMSKDSEKGNINSKKNDKKIKTIVRRKSVNSISKEELKRLGDKEFIQSLKNSRNLSIVQKNVCEENKDKKIEEQIER